MNAPDAVDKRATRPVAEGLFEASAVPGEPPWLLGSRCVRCAETVFPPMLDCPACVSHGTMRGCRLRGRGRLERYVVAQRGPSGFTTPYIQAFVRLDDGPTVYSMIDGCAATDDALTHGQALEMSLGPVRRDGDVEVIGWIFHPLESAHG